MNSYLFTTCTLSILLSNVLFGSMSLLVSDNESSAPNPSLAYKHAQRQPATSADDAGEKDRIVSFLDCDDESLFEAFKAFVDNLQDHTYWPQDWLLEDFDDEQLLALLNTLPEGLYKICIRLLAQAEDRAIIHDIPGIRNLCYLILDAADEGILCLERPTLTIEIIDKMAPLIKLVNAKTPLTEVSFVDGQLREVPTVIGQLTVLQYLSVGNNPITQLPAWLSALADLTTIDTTGCPLENSPEEASSESDEEAFD